MRIWRVRGPRGLVVSAFAAAGRSTYLYVQLAALLAFVAAVSEAVPVGIEADDLDLDDEFEALPRDLKTSGRRDARRAPPRWRVRASPRYRGPNRPSREGRLDAGDLRPGRWTVVGDAGGQERPGRQVAGGRRRRDLDELVVIELQPQHHRMRA